MRFKRRIRLEHGLEQINLAPLIDVIFQLLIFFMLSSSFTFQKGIHVKLPPAVTSEPAQSATVVLTITDDDVLYFQGRVITVKELREQLKTDPWKGKPVMIKADRRASLGRIVEIWDLCRELGIEHINIATTQPAP